MALNPDVPGTLVLIPAALMVRAMATAYAALRAAGK